MFPPAFEEKLQTLLGGEYAAFCASFNRPRNVGLRRNTLRPAVPLPEFGLQPVAWCPEGYRYDPALRPGLHPYHEAGLYYLQEPSAMAPAELLAPQPGERVLDLCAAPGGKATQLAAAMQGRGILICNEIHPQRARILSRNIERMGVRNAIVLNETPQRLQARFDRYFDRVLVDAPCSGEGMFRKEEAAVQDWSPETVRLCASRQLEVLSCAAAMLRPGGRLVYSTCTFSPEENEGVIAQFLDAHPDFELEQLPAPWFSPARPEWADGRETLRRAFRLWPHLVEGEGHFAAALRRAPGEAAPEPPRLKAAPLPADCRVFLQEQLAEQPQGEGVLFGETVYLAPEGTPELGALRVLRAGLERGRCLRGRFEPAHALALAVPAAQQVHYAVDSDEIARYLRGETLPGHAAGWSGVCAGDLVLGWAKGSAGQLKNHFPKGLRWASAPVFPPERRAEG